MARKSTPKVSPLRGMSVDAWLETRASGWHLDVARQALAVAREAAPKATLAIKWGIPVLEENGPVAFVRIAKAHVTFGFWRGAQLTDPEALLEGGETMRHWKLSGLEALDRPSLKRLVREAVQLNRTLGDPTRRA